MGADIVHGVEGAVDVEESNHFPSNADNLTCAGRHLIDFCDFHHSNFDAPLRIGHGGIPDTRQDPAVALFASYVHPVAVNMESAFLRNMDVGWREWGVRTPLVQAEAGERSGNSLREH
jgi:hypothetical protein